MSAQAEYSDGDKHYGVDWDNKVEGIHQNGVLTGWTLAQNATPNMSVDVAAGTGFAGQTYVSTGSTTNVSITAAHGTLDRLDIIVMNSSGTLSSIAGTPHATAPNPPDLPADNICLAIVAVDAAVSAIYDADITSRRLLISTVIPRTDRAQTISGAWDFTGILDMKTTLRMSAAQKISFCYTAETEVGEIHAVSADTVQLASANWRIGGGDEFQFGDGTYICGVLRANSEYMQFRNNDSDNIFTYPRDGNDHTRLNSFNGYDVIINASDDIELTAGGDLNLNPSGKILANDDIEMQNSDLIFRTATSESGRFWGHDTDTVMMDTDFSPDSNCARSLGYENSFATVWSDHLYDVSCSEYDLPNQALEIIGMLPEILTQDAPPGKFETKNYPLAFKAHINPRTKQLAHAKPRGLNTGRNLSMTVDYLIWAVSELKARNEVLEERMLAWESGS